jgi:hypothetical protein
MVEQWRRNRGGQGVHVPPTKMPGGTVPPTISDNGHGFKIIRRDHPLIFVVYYLQIGTIQGNYNHARK